MSSLDELSAEDALRLAVLLAGELHAVRIDEGTLQLHALTPRGEARLDLHPDTRAERYLMRVREVLAGHVLGSPGGYPVYLRRWTRSGHANPKSLAALLCLGEPEAVTAVALSPQIDDELARRVWWVQPTADIARYLLQHDAVRRGRMGPALARHLFEHLPFEEDPDTAMHSVRVAVGLLDDDGRQRLWRAARNRPHYLIAWLEAAPQAVPMAPAGRTLPPAICQAVEAGEAWAAQWALWASASGQGLLAALILVVEKPPTHEAVYRMLDLLGRHFEGAADLHAPPAFDAELAAMRTLARSSRRDAEPTLRRTSAVGPLMRRHLTDVLAPLGALLRQLKGTP